jgi:hypothetical protein
LPNEPIPSVLPNRYSPICTRVRLASDDEPPRELSLETPEPEPEPDLLPLPLAAPPLLRPVLLLRELRTPSPSATPLPSLIAHAAPQRARSTAHPALRTRLY